MIDKEKIERLTQIASDIHALREEFYPPLVKKCEYHHAGVDHLTEALRNITTAISFYNIKMTM